MTHVETVEDATETVGIVVRGEAVHDKTVGEITLTANGESLTGDGGCLCEELIAGGVGRGQAAAPGALFWVLRNGSLKRGMPSFAHLPDPQRWQIITFFKTLGGQ